MNRSSYLPSRGGHAPTAAQAIADKLDRKRKRLARLVRHLDRQIKAKWASGLETDSKNMTETKTMIDETKALCLSLESQILKEGTR